MEREYVWQIGDEFKIKVEKNFPKWMRCKSPDKTFIVHSTTNYYVNYIDNRTNIKCRCEYCTSEKVKEYSYKNGEYDFKPYKRVNKSLCILVRTKNQRAREISLKILNI
jgi:hypothetical protein